MRGKARYCSSKIVTSRRVWKWGKNRIFRRNSHFDDFYPIFKLSWKSQFLSYNNVLHLVGKGKASSFHRGAARLCRTIISMLILILKKSAHIRTVDRDSRWSSFQRGAVRYCSSKIVTSTRVWKWGKNRIFRRNFHFHRERFVQFSLLAVNQSKSEIIRQQNFTKKP